MGVYKLSVMLNYDKLCNFKNLSMMTTSLSGSLVRVITRRLVVIRSVESLSKTTFSTSAQPGIITLPMIN